MGESVINYLQRREVPLKDIPANPVTTETPPSSPLASVGHTLRWTLSVLPTWCILAVLGGIGWYGHHTGWTMPKWASWRGEVHPIDDWCSEHNVPESICVECNPDLLPRGTSHGWCREHGVHECTLCFPQGAQLNRESGITSEDRQRATSALLFTPRPANNAICKLHQRRLQFADERAVEKAGIEVEAAWKTTVVEYVAAPGTLGYDQTRVVHLSARSAGTVWKVFKHLGQDVKAGDVLALVDAADVGKAKAEILQAYATWQLRTKTLASLREAGNAIPVARLREVETELREAEIRLIAGCQTLTNLGLPLDEADVRRSDIEQLKTKLHMLGIPSEIAQSLATIKPTSNLLPLIAPMDGLIVSRDVVAGEVVDLTRILFEVVDTRSLWLTLDVKSEEASRIRIGQNVEFKPDHSRNHIRGQVAWRSTHVDPKTRTVKVRADIADPERQLFANVFGTGRIILRHEPQAVVVPNGAVHWEGCCYVVFVRDRNFLQPDAPKVFHTRTVRIGAIDDKNTEIIAGVLPNELVAVRNSSVLKAELLRGNLGEG